jgi:hypothetical protein
MLIFCCAFSIAVRSQQIPSHDQFAIIKGETQNTLGIFTHYLEQIASNQVTDSEKALKIYSAIKLFAKKGNTSVEVSNKYKSGLTTYYLDDYLFNIVARYNLKYSNLIFLVQSYSMNERDFVPIYKNGEFEGYTVRAEYSQVFKGESRTNRMEVSYPEHRGYKANAHWDYQDITRKCLIVTVKVKKQLEKRPIYIIQLGDVKIVETR